MLYRMLAVEWVRVTVRGYIDIRVTSRVRIKVELSDRHLQRDK